MARRHRKIRFPLTVRQAQKLAGNPAIPIASLFPLMEAIGMDSDFDDRDQLQAELSRMAAKLSPSWLITQSSSGLDGDEGDNSNAQPNSFEETSEEEEQRGNGDPSDDRSETGEIPTSEGQGKNGDGKSPQDSNRRLGQSPSTAMGDSDRTDGTYLFLENAQLRDADVQEPANSQHQIFPQHQQQDQQSDVFQDQQSDAVPSPQEGGHQGSDAPTHQKKWGKKFTKEEVVRASVSTSANKSHGGVTVKLDIGIDAKLVRLCRQRLSLLVGDSTFEHSFRRDYAEFCVRLKTYRNPSSARKEEEGRPAILIMADVSGSCSSFSEESVRVAKAASRLGVPGAEVLVLTHSNGFPEELEHNGRSQTVPPQVDDTIWYQSLIQRFQIKVVIALGDWDAVDFYISIASNQLVERLIWLDKGYSSQVRDRTKSALTWISERSPDISQIRHKLTYRDGCRDALTFVNNIK